MERIFSYLDNNNHSQEEFDLISLYFGEAEQIPFDKDGRIVAPKVDTTCSIKNEILFVGLGPTFQMWNPGKIQEN